MLEDAIFNLASFRGGMMASVVPHIFNHIEHIPSIIIAIIISAILTIYIIYSYVTLVVIPKKAEELLEEYYPEYKLA